MLNLIKKSPFTLKSHIAWFIILKTWGFKLFYGGYNYTIIVIHQLILEKFNIIQSLYEENTKKLKISTFWNFKIWELRGWKFESYSCTLDWTFFYYYFKILERELFERNNFWGFVLGFGNSILNIWVLGLKYLI